MINYLIIFLSVTVSIWILFLVRRNLLHLSYSLFWLLIAFIILLLGLFPNINMYLAKKLGVQYYPILPVVIAIMIIFIKLLKQDLELTEKKKLIKRLAQEVAILKAELKKNKTQQDASNSRR